MTGQRRTGQRPAPSRWPLGRILGAAVLLVTPFSVAAVVTGALALAHLDTERQRVVTTIDPAALEAQQLYSALLNQETGVRGYALSANPGFLAPYTQGLTAESAALDQLRPLLPMLPAATVAELRQTVSQANDWRARYAEPTIAQIQASGKPVAGPDILAGKVEFDALRGRFAGFQAGVSASRQQALTSLYHAANALHVTLLVIAVGLAAVVAGLAV